ncbi:Glycosyltransferase involved in cell wall bisynthesis [Pseudomonas sp. ok272]|nr:MULTISPECIES: glycosyltransferase family 4 protein [unclassified Pseudomonas]SEM52938.1 Glycosyltransferase involved in cell wall bisynthesis [Pseudomonas sp. ok272]SFM24837.1 Glycosyltransferase involved in cell wall bisynthesis [Pseudomonas sp. ok602]
MNGQAAPALPIIHLLSSGGFYGAERMLLDHCLATPGRHQVLFLDAPPALVSRFREAQVDCQPINGLRELLRHLRSRRSERPLINTHNFKGLVLGWVAATWLRLPLVITQHGFTPRSRKQRLYTWLSLQLCRTASVDRVVCVAESIALLCRQASVRADKLHVIPNGLPHLRVPARARHDRQRWLAGFVGRLSVEKGPDLFLDALIPLCRQHPKLYGVMLGDGPERPSLLARVNAAGLHERIRLPGYQTDMDTWWMQLDALVISSRTEGTPMILLEAMQAGVPVAAFAVGGIPDVLQDEHNGLLAAPADSAGLARQIERLHRDPDQARNLADNARRTQLERYDLRALAQRWSQLYIRTAQEARA